MKNYSEMKYLKLFEGFDNSAASHLDIEDSFNMLIDDVNLSLNDYHVSISLRYLFGGGRTNPFFYLSRSNLSTRPVADSYYGFNIDIMDELLHVISYVGKFYKCAYIHYLQRGNGWRESHIDNSSENYIEDALNYLIGMDLFKIEIRFTEK